jgi:predicted metal-dependent peptidase
MTQNGEKQSADDPEVQRRLEHALRLVLAPFPHFAGLARIVRITQDSRVPTMGVFASGRLAVNPQFVRQLQDNELVFVLAHEIFHLALRTHDRAIGSDPLRFNYAHDYIINDILRDELGFQHIPAGGLDMPGARQMSAEEILLKMDRDPNHADRQPDVWQRSSGQGQGKPMRESQSGRGNQQGSGQDQGEGGDGGPKGDVLDSRLERKLYPDENTSEQQAQEEAVKEMAGKALSLGKAMDAMKGMGRGSDAGAANQMVTALRGLYRTPWEMALQRWLEAVAPGPRTFNRASRRGAERTDVVLPGRRREGWILNVVLDTSGSMTNELPRALGAIADFCDAAAVDQIRLVQCDTAVTSDRFLTPDELTRYQVTGGGGSDLSPALRYLADDARVEAAIVLTDGDITFPPEEMPYGVLWVLPAQVPSGFHPPYGTVIAMTKPG